MNTRSNFLSNGDATLAPTRMRVPRIAAFVIGLLLVLVILGVHDAAAQDVRTVSFDEAVDIALEQNITLKRVANVAEYEAITATERRAIFYPDFYVSGRGTQSYGRNFIADEARIINTTTEQLGVGVGSSVNLFRGFGDVAALRQARLSQEAAELDYDRARQSVVFEVMSNYLALIEQREQIRVREENLEAQRQQLDQVVAIDDGARRAGQRWTSGTCRARGLVEVGSRPPSDLYQQQAAVAEAELQLVNAERAYQVSEVNLIQTLQLDPFDDYRFTVPEAGDVDALEEHELGDLLQEAFARRADLQARETEIDAAREGISLAKSSRWPSVGLTFGYGTNYTTADRFGLFDQFDQRRGGSVDLNLRLPIFDRYNTKLNVERAQVQYNDARLSLQDARQNIAVQVRQAFLDLRSAAKALDVSATQEIAAEKALEVEQERYTVGVGTLVELSLARAQHVQAASSRVTAKYDYLFQTKLIDYYLGILDPAETLF